MDVPKRMHDWLSLQAIEYLDTGVYLETCTYKVLLITHAEIVLFVISYVNL